MCERIFYFFKDLLLMLFQSCRKPKGDIPRILLSLHIGCKDYFLWTLCLYICVCVCVCVCVCLRKSVWENITLSFWNIHNLPNTIFVLVFISQVFKWKYGDIYRQTELHIFILLAKQHYSLKYCKCGIFCCSLRPCHHFGQSI